MELKDVKIVTRDVLELFDRFIEEYKSFEEMSQKIIALARNAESKFSVSDLNIIDIYNVTRVNTYPKEVLESGWFYVLNDGQIVTWVNTHDGFDFYTWDSKLVLNI